MPKITPKHRVAILLHEGINGEMGKTGIAYLRYGEGEVVAVIDYQSANQSLKAVTGINRDIPIVANVDAALKYNPDVLIIGIAPSRGRLPETWWQEIKLAIDAGVSIANGLHTQISTQVESLQPKQWIWDIRQEPQNLPIGKGLARHLTCKRILTVGTDMGVGKMSTTIELTREAQKQGIKSKFIATGQGGLMIAGDGIPLDAVRVDFAAGAVEDVVLKFAPDHQWLLVEGQGSILHPGSTATLPLIRGTQPTDLILVHRAHQTHIRDLPECLIPDLNQVVRLYEDLASVAGGSRAVKVRGIALNTFHLGETEAIEAIKEVESTTGLPCTDVVRFGANLLIKAILNNS